MSKVNNSKWTNKNSVVVDGFSNQTTEKIYKAKWQNEPATKKLYDTGKQCGGCSFYAKLNQDWGLCCYSRSNHYLEAIFEHFTCNKI